MRTAEETTAIRQRLSEIEKAGGGRLTPDAVVADARKKDSPLHACFEWDVKKAAAAHWIEQARELIVSVRVVIKTEYMRVDSPFYVRDPSAGTKQGYVSVPSLRTESDLAREVLVAEFGRVADMLRRARGLAAALDADNEVEDLITQVVGLRERFMVAEATA